MEYLEIVNLEKYQHYKDRNMVWFKWHIDCLQDYKFSKLTDAQRWIFIGLTCLACKCNNKIPNDNSWICKQISNSKSISKDIAILKDIGLLASCYQNAIPIREEKRREDKRREEEIIYADFEKSAFNSWNSFSLKFPVLPKINEITASRRISLKKRFEKESFKDFNKILDAISKQPFVLGENDRKWTVSFDWLIENDTNYIKILELKYESKNITKIDRLKDMSNCYKKQELNNESV